MELHILAPLTATLMQSQSLVDTSFIPALSQTLNPMLLHPHSKFRQHKRMQDIEFRKRGIKERTFAQSNDSAQRLSINVPHGSKLNRFLFIVRLVDA